MRAARSCLDFLILVQDYWRNSTGAGRVLVGVVVQGERFACLSAGGPRNAIASRCRQDQTSLARGLYLSCLAQTLFYPILLHRNLSLNPRPSPKLKRVCCVCCSASDAALCASGGGNVAVN